MKRRTHVVGCSARMIAPSHGQGAIENQLFIYSDAKARADAELGLALLANVHAWRRARKAVTS